MGERTKGTLADINRYGLLERVTAIAAKQEKRLTLQGQSISIYLQEKAMTIKKEKDGEYRVVSKTGKNLGGNYKTKDEAQKRLREVEYFKRKSKPK